MATLSWQCPCCDFEDYEEGTCPTHYVPLVAVRPAAKSVPESGQLVLETPWGQIDIPTGGIEIGRSTSARAGAVPGSFDQVSRRHVRLTPVDPDTVQAEDLDSTNRTFIDGEAVPPEEPCSLRTGQQLRLGEDVECTLVKLDEFGVPVPAEPGYPTGPSPSTPAAPR